LTTACTAIPTTIGFASELPTRLASSTTFAGLADLLQLAASNQPGGISVREIEYDQINGDLIAKDLDALRAHLAEIGVIATQGPRYVRDLADRIEAGEETIPLVASEALAPLVLQLPNLDEAIARFDRAIAKPGAVNRSGMQAEATSERGVLTAHPGMRVSW
jgi:hypothetical protein